MIPNAKPNLNQDEINHLIEVINSNWLTTGPKVQEFEKNFKEFVGSTHALAVSSGTAALELAVTALKIKHNFQDGDEIITTPLTFAATANAILYNNLKPVFVDVKPDTLNIDPEKIKAAITEKTKAIIFVDYAGQLCDIDEIKNIAQQNNLFLIEDAAHALGAKYKDKIIGTQADLTTFSFHPAKNITTAEGGMVTTEDKELHDLMLLLRNHGIDKSDKSFGGDWSYNQKLLGRNYRLSDIHCALGVTQLKKLNKFNETRTKIAEKYTSAFNNLPEITLPKIKENITHSWHLFPILLNGIDRNQCFKN